MRMHTLQWEHHSADTRPWATQVARYAIDGVARPSAAETVMVAEAMRKAVQSRYGRATGGAVSPVFSGHSSTGEPLHGHRHARYLATDEDGDGRLDHFSVVSASGFGAREQAALLAADHV